MTAYPRIRRRDAPGKKQCHPRDWLYQTPKQILMKGLQTGHPTSGTNSGNRSSGGSLLTFEHTENYKKFAYDKVDHDGRGYRLREPPRRPQRGAEERSRRWW